MKNIITFEQATKLNILLLSLIGLMHSVLIINNTVFNYSPTFLVWGGQIDDSQQFLRLEIFSLVVIVLFLLVVLVNGKRIKSQAFIKPSKIALYVISGYFLLNTVGNLLAVSFIEKAFALVTLAVSYCSYRMAVEPIK
jgi:Cu/Ag efflux pump CusA